MSVSFVPSDCTAFAMQACLKARMCKLLDLDIPGINETFGGVANLFAGADITLDAKHLCLKAALKAAFETAGCTFPVDPPRPAPPDFSACQAILDDFSDQVANPLRLFSSVMTITLNADMLPILITVP